MRAEELEVESKWLCSDNPNNFEQVQAFFVAGAEYATEEEAESDRARLAALVAKFEGIPTEEIPKYRLVKFVDAGELPAGNYEETTNAAP